MSLGLTDCFELELGIFRSSGILNVGLYFSIAIDCFKKLPWPRCGVPGDNWEGFIEFDNLEGADIDSRLLFLV